MREEIGFIGLGVMGRPMAGNLRDKYAVTGYDVDESRFQELTGVARSHSLSELARRCQFLCLSLPTAAVVEEVTIGAKGLVNDLKPGTVVIDFSTNLPSVARRIAETLAERNVEFVDAPVSGGEAGAKAASLAIMVGAAPETFRKCLALLSTLGKTVVRVGDVGAGCVAKLVNNMIVGSAFAVIAEGFALAEKNGVDSRLLYESIREGWAGSKVLDVSAAAIATKDYTPGGTISMLEKDLSYSRSMAAESCVPIPMTAAAHEILVAGQAAGWGAFSQPAIIELWRKMGRGNEAS
jgi:2-hydroxy-3-oxopropionate reductase